jgi:hypothetical protein
LERFDEELASLLRDGCIVCVLIDLGNLVGRSCVLGEQPAFPFDEKNKHFTGQLLVLARPGVPGTIQSRRRFRRFRKRCARIGTIELEQATDRTLARRR